MRRAVARGRLFPQSYSTDRRYGRLSLKACALFPLMWANADDQGRLCGDPEEIKYAVCPNIDHITKADMPELLQELEQHKLIKAYETPKSAAIQLLDWWEVQRPQWAYPSQYPSPEGWQDRLRYHATPKEIVTENWISPSQVDRELPNPLPGKQTACSVEPADDAAELPDELGNSLDSPSLLTSHPEKEDEKEKEKERRRGRGNIPSALGSPSPSPAGFPPSEIEILQRLTSCFRKEWGRVPAERPYEIIPREPDARESAQLRDLAKEISATGGCPLEHVDQAFRDAAARPDKMHISYVRAILLDWLGVERARSP